MSSAADRVSTDTKRAANFSVKEESILLCLVKKYKTILENKKTDNNTNKKKAECWKTVEEEFNSQSGENYRDSNNLRKKYENLKKKTKKKISEEKCYSMGTGGGPPKKPPEITETDMELKEILGERISGLPSEFGGDAEIITIINESNEEINMGATHDISNVLGEKENIFQNSYIENESTSNAETFTWASTIQHKENSVDWTKYSIESLRTPKSKALTTGEPSSKRKRNEYDALCNKVRVSQWAGAKAELESEKKKNTEDEHAVKIILMKEKNQAEIDHMEKESKAKINLIEKEMAATIDGIKERNKIKKEILLLEKHILVQKIKTEANF